MNIFNKNNIILISKSIDGTKFTRDSDSRTYSITKKFYWINYNNKYICNKNITSKELDSLKFDEDLLKIFDFR